MKRTELEDAIRREVEQWPDVKVDFIEGKKHPKAKFSYAGNILSRSYAGTPSDSRFGLHQTLGDMRRTMRQLGAERAAPDPTPEEDEAPYRKPNEGRKKRPDPVQTPKAKPDPDLADKLVETGAATEQQAKKARAPATVVSVPGDDQTDEEAAREARIAEFENKVAAIGEGIYFGLSDDIYHAVPALGGSSMGDLLVSAGTWWRGSWLDPDRPELDEDATKAQIAGKAYHCARLEPDQFEIRFVRELDKADFPQKGFVGNGEQIGAALGELGETKKRAGESVEEQGQRLEDAGFEGCIWPLEKARWQKTIGTRTPIPAKVWDEIIIDQERLQANPEILNLLSGGASEVSVFWTDENGIRCKCRFDHLRVAGWADMKTFANPNGKELDRLLTDIVQFNRLHIQAGHYRDGYAAIAAGAVAIVGDASEDQRALVAGIVGREANPVCHFVFQEKGGVPNLLAKKFPFHIIDTYREHEIATMVEDENARVLVEAMHSEPSQLYLRAQFDIARAKQVFALYSQVYPPGTPWHPIDAVSSFRDADFNQRWLERK